MIIKTAILEELISHAKADAPIEACGYLAEKEGVVVAIHRMRNVDASPEHFSFDPVEQFAAVRQMRAQGTRLCAVYHSHPSTPARPSQEDIRLANDPALVYIIVSLADLTPQVKAFTIKNGQVSPEPLVQAS